MTRNEASGCPGISIAKHDWAEVTTVEDAGRRFRCAWCSAEAFEPLAEEPQGKDAQ